MDQEEELRRRPNATVAAVDDLETGSGQQDDDHRRPGPVVWLYERLSAYFSKAAAMMVPATVIGKMFHLLYHSHDMPWGSAVFFGIVSFLSFLPSCYAKWPMQNGREASHVQRLCKMAYVSTMLRMLAAFTLLHFYEVLYYFVIPPLVPFLLLLLWLLKRMMEDSLDHMFGATSYRDVHGTQLELLFDLSAEAVSMCFSGLCGALLGYVKNNSLDLTRGHKSSECFLFYGTTIGLLVELLATVPPSGYLEDRRRRIVEVYLRFLAYAAVLFLLMACLAAAEVILHELIFFAFSADVLVVVLCFWENHTNDETHLRWVGDRSHEERNEDLKRCLHPPFIRALIFSALIASYTTYVGKVDSSGSDLTNSLSWQFKGFVLAMLSTIVTYFTWIVVVLETPCLDSWAYPKQAWAWATHLLMAFTAIFFVLLFVGHRDELWSII